MRSRCFLYVGFGTIFKQSRRFGDESFYETTRRFFLLHLAQHFKLTNLRLILMRLKKAYQGLIYLGKLVEDLIGNVLSK